MVIAGGKFPIKKIPTYIYPWAKLPLPCEYEKLDNTVSLQYKTDADTTYGVKQEYEFGGDILITVMSKSKDTSDVKYIHLNNFLDTFVVSKNDLGTLKPYIKSKSDTILFLRKGKWLKGWLLNNIQSRIKTQWRCFFLLSRLLG